MKKKKNNNKKTEPQKKKFHFTLPEEVKKWIWGIITLVVSLIIVLSFFEKAGVAGKGLMIALTFLIGKAVFLVPLILVIGGLVFFKTTYKKFLGSALIAILILVIGITSLLELFYPEQKSGGWIGYISSWPFFQLFGVLASKFIFSGFIIVGALIFWYLIRGPRQKIQDEKNLFTKTQESESLIKKIFAPKFKVKELEPKPKEEYSPLAEEPLLELKSEEISKKYPISEYKLPPIDLLEEEKGKPTAGDTVTNSTIIKKTLENFGLSVEMSEVNVGPTVTQYTLKPAEGIKLSKITGLSNNLSLALASHPIRIEAPIPGKPLVGVEIPNKTRCRVRLRDLMASPSFQTAKSNLVVVLGKDVSGNYCYADLARMPHLLVAGATGTGKTVFLNSLIMGLLYQNSPETLRFILVDPKRVEFSAYKNLPHLLAPVIFDAQRTVNALRWLVSEMEKRFDILSQNGSRDISSYNAKALKAKEETLPYIVLIIDELADLMAAKGRDVEAGIVRLAQMARAVGIHLVVATQRPSVEVITGLIKANITSRVTFQVASQVDSRTVLDTAGAEKLLGGGDLLFLSPELGKPRRVQGAYVSEKEVTKVVEWVKSQKVKEEGGEGDFLVENHLAEELEKTLEEGGNGNSFDGFEGGDDDPLYQEAKKIVIESRKASASLLQRRLRLGYARAARLLDMLEENGVVGPGEGAKPREVYFNSGENEEGEEWKKV